MIVHCEECGKKYQIDPDKIQGGQARFTCKGCGHVVTVFKPTEEPAVAPPPARPAPPPRPESEARASRTPAPMDPEEGAKKSKEGKKKKKTSMPKRMGLRSKMFLLFFLVPILCIAAGGWLYMQQLNKLSDLITKRSADTVNIMAEELIEMKARTVARQAMTFLDTHPGLQKENFYENPEFREITVQKVGKTGYTALYTIPDENGVSSLWTHPNEKLIGVDLKTTMEKALGKGFARFWKVYGGAFNGKISRGYYPWQDADGEIREKYMVCLPIENTPYVVPATTYLYEFTTPVKDVQAKAQQVTVATRYTIMAIVAATIILIGVIVSLFGHRLTGRIQSLTDVADRISVGELDADVKVSSGDEIGDLGDAVVRMQDSIRLSIERLRRNR